MMDLTQITNQDALVLTVNRRLSAHLHANYDKWLQDTGSQAGLTPKILPLSTWLLTHCYSSEKYLLSDTQALFLWQSIIEKDSNLLCEQQAAKDAFEAWGLLQAWQQPISVLEHEPSEDISAFYRWAQSYQELLLRNHWDDSATVMQSILENLPATLPQTIYLVGFEQFTPIVSAIIKKLEHQSTVIQVEQPNKDPQLKINKAQNTEAELAAMVAWAKANQEKKIACVVANTSEHYLFLKEQLPEANIAASVALSSYPIVASALLLLKVYCTETDYLEQSSLLRSPFIKGDITEQCKLDVALRESEFQFATEQFDSTSHREFATHFIGLLQKHGWPGNRVLTSEEFQTKERFEALLKEFAGCDVLQQKIPTETALQQLTQMTNNTVFQPKSTESNVQVLGLLETAGLKFDAIWVTGMTDENWPPPLAPNPFLPVWLQRKLLMPRANANHELRYSEKVMHRICSSAADINISFAAMDGDRPLAPCPFFHRHQSEDIYLEKAPTLSSKTESYADVLTVPVKTDEKISGGSYILKAQAACPFKAFAEIRLHAEEIPEPVAGLPAHERGSIVHDVLQSIWQELKTHADLLAISDQTAFLAKHIDATLQNYPDTPALTLEHTRLQRLLTKWLDYEKQRPPFAVAGCEIQQKIEIAGLAITVRLDRIDQLANNSYAIIDYKTGNVSMNDWFGDRPLEPQLPLYCINTPDAATISFAQVKLAGVGFVGVSAHSDLIPDNKPVTKFADDWEDLRQQWSTSLTRLAESFMAGEAAVNPKNGTVTCQYCHLQPVCRIFEHGR